MTFRVPQFLATYGIAAVLCPITLLRTPTTSAASGQCNMTLTYNHVTHTYARTCGGNCASACGSVAQDQFTDGNWYWVCTCQGTSSVCCELGFLTDSHGMLVIDADGDCQTGLCPGIHNCREVDIPINENDFYVVGSCDL